MISYKDTGERVKEARKNILKYTQQELANHIEVSRNYIAMIERGERKLTDGVAYRIAKICDIDPEYLLLKTNDPNKNYKGESLILCLGTTGGDKKINIPMYFCPICGRKIAAPEATNNGNGDGDTSVLQISSKGV